MEAKAKVFIYANAFKGEVRLTDFRVVEESLDSLKNEEFLVEAIYISLDPYQRTLMLSFPVGSMMLGRQIAK